MCCRHWVKCFNFFHFYWLWYTVYITIFQPASQSPTHQPQTYLFCFHFLLSNFWIKISSNLFYLSQLFFNAPEQKFSNGLRIPTRQKMDVY
jgi:hypothetical protein